MILHLLSDDKFSDYAISQFEDYYPKGNEFVILVWSNAISLQYIKKKSNIKLLIHNSPEVDILCDSLHLYKAIITHNLSTPSQQKIVENAPENVKIAWVFWGFEVYSNKINEFRYYTAKTRIIYLGFEIVRLLKNIKNISQGKPMDNKHYEVNKKTFRRINFCLTDIAEDYEIAKKYYNADFNFLWYNYYSIEDTLGSIKDNHLSGTNILIGNSATLSNNHVDILDKLSHISVGTRKVIIPLSYGNKDYAKLITQIGKNRFRRNLLVLDTFIPRDEYNRILLSCSIVIMYQKRHQAMGNILTALWIGSKVYLCAESTTFKYLKRLGMVVFSVEQELTSLNPLALEPLDLDDIKRNRAILEREYGREKIKERIEKVINTLTT